ncbi:MAG: hypothetical protein ACYDCG_01115 [Candidatus Acidiferrales bacterium]
MSSGRVFSRYCSLLVIAILFGTLCMLETAHAQSSCTPPSFSGDESSWRAAYINWCKSNGGNPGNFYSSSGDYTGWGCHPIEGQWKCGGAASATSPNSTTSTNPLVTIVQTYQTAIETARARDAAMRDAATASNNHFAASASQNAEVTEDAAQADDLAHYNAEKATESQADQDAFAREHDSAAAFLNQNAALSSTGSNNASPAQQKAWKQLHCLAYVSRIAFVDLALNDITDYHDLAPEASKAFDGAAMDVSCPAAPLPDLSGKNNVDMGKVSAKLKSDLDQATQIAQHMEKYKPQQTTLPPVPPDVASDPQLAAAWKVQQAINAINDAPNPGKTPAEFSQIVNDRDQLRQSLTDSNNAASGNFGSIQVNLTSAPSSGSAPQ